MRVLIFEPDSGGHRLQYVAAILNALAPFQISVVLVCEQGIRKADEFATHLGQVCDRVEIDARVPKVRRKAVYSAAVLRFLALREAIARHRPDHVYIPYADGLIQLAGVAAMMGCSLHRPGMEIEGLMMRGKFAYEPHPMSIRTRIIAKALGKAPFNVVHHLDPIVYDYIQQHFPVFAKRFRLLPEAVETIESLDRSTARLKLGLVPSGRYLGCLGALSAAKGVAFLLEAFAGASLATDTRLLLVGKPDTELRGLLRGKYLHLCEMGRIVCLDRYVSQHEFHLSFMASDVICALYHRQIGSSGIVVRAAAAAKPLLGSDFGWVGRVIRDFELGTVCDVTNVQRLGAELLRALECSNNYRPGAKAQFFADFHRLDNFEWHWTRRLRERLGLAVPHRVAEWAWPTATSNREMLHA